MPVKNPHIERTKSTESIDTASSSGIVSDWTPSDEEKVVEDQSLEAASSASQLDPSADIGNPSSSDQPQHESTSEAPHESTSEEEPESDLPMDFRHKKKKRKYNCKNRQPATKKSIPRQVCWLAELSAMSLAKFRRSECCTQRRCFHRVNYNYYLHQAAMILSADQDTRGTILRSFLDGDRKFRFDGRRVCVRFLRKGFRFSAVRIAEVVSGRVKRPLPPTSSISSQVASARSSNNSQVVASVQSTSTVSSASFILKKKEAIISFIQRMADDCGDYMPNKTEVHLPFHQIQELYPIFAREFKILYPTVQLVSPAYFRQVWMSNCGHIKIMKSSRFATCSTCDQLRTKLRERIVTGTSAEEIKNQRFAHLKFVKSEREEYTKKRDRARLHSSDYCSFIVDGADQSAFGLPHFTTSTKGQKGHALKVKLVGLLEHRLQSRLTLLTMTEEHKTGANHIVETIHRFLTRRRSESKLPDKLFVQLDNCSRENKNKYLMAYLEMLVARSVFSCVEVGFLPVGHTHEDIDQVFSRTSTRLRATNAITLDDLHSVLRKTFNNSAHVEHMKRIANWSGLCDRERCLNRIDNITQWRYFQFVPASSSAIEKDGEKHSNAEHRPTVCYVKKDSYSEWRRMFPERKGVPESPSGILRRTADLSLTPPLHIECPPGVDKVTKRLCSEDERINDPEKLIQLHELRDFVFANRIDPFHWDLNSAFETEHDRVNGGQESDQSDDEEQQSPQESGDNNGDSDADFTGNDVDEDRDEQEDDQDQVTVKVDYAIGSFVLVKNIKGSNEFWVGKVLEVKKANQTNFVSRLKVHWYDCDSGKDDGPVSDPLYEKYHPCYKKLENKKRKACKRTTRTSTRQQLQEPWCDEIHTDTVLVNFDGLTKKHHIPISAQKRIVR